MGCKHMEDTGQACCHGETCWASEFACAHSKRPPILGVDILDTPDTDGLLALLSAFTDDMGKGP